MPRIDRIQGHAARAVLGTMLAVGFFAALAGDAQATAFGTNLIVNGSAEADAPSATGFEVVPVITGWIRTGNLTIVPWSGVGDFPDNADPGPVARGAGFFAGGPNNASSQLLQSIDISDLAGTIDAGVALPGLAFSAIVPNPVRDGARFDFRLPMSDRARLDVMDVHGRSVAVIAEGAFAAGAHAPVWRRSEAIPPGVYFARLQVGSQVMRRRFVVLD